MSVIRPRPPEDPISHRATAGCPLADDGGRLAAIRDGLVASPFGIDLAPRVLAEYAASRPDSGLFAILGTARRIRDTVDRVVLVAGGPIAPATRLLAAACCHPFHDQLPRGERGGRPRLSWLDGSSGDDEVQGVLDLAPASGADDLLDRWAVVAVDSPADDPALAAVLEVLLARLSESVGGDEARLAARFVPVAMAGGRLAERGRRLGCGDSFTAVAETAGPQGPFTAACLLPAAVAGIDVVRLLQGAEAMARRFAEAPASGNPPLVDAAVAARAAAAGRPGRVFACPGRWVTELADWHGRLRPVPAGSAAVVTTIDPGTPRRDRLTTLLRGGDRSAGGTPAAAEAADVAIGLPRLDEHAVGQLLQLLVISLAVEERLRRGV